MAFEKNLNGDDLIARISEILDKAEQFGKKRADQVGTEIGKALSDGIQEEMDDAKKDVKNSVGELMAEWQKLVRSINNNKLQMKPEKIKVVLDTAEALKDTERFGKEVRKQLSGIAATFNGVKIKGLDAVAKKFKTSSEELESIDWGFGKHHDTMIQQVTKQADAVKDVGDAAKATQAAVEELTKREKDLANILDKLKEIKDETNAFNDPSIQKTEEKVRKLIGALDEYQTKLDAMRRLRKGNERTMYDTAKSEIADLKRALGAVQTIEDQTPNIKPKIEKKEKEVEQEKSKKTTTQQTKTPVVGAGDSAKSIQEQTAAIKQQTSAMESLGKSTEKTAKQVGSIFDPVKQKKYTDYINGQIKDTERSIQNQQDWIRHLGWVFDDGRFASSGKKDAYDKLKLAAMRYNDASRRKTAGTSISEDEIELATIAWKKAYDEAVKQGVAERRLYDYKPPMWSYDSSLQRVQGDYDYRKKALGEGEVKLTSLKRIQGNIEGFTQLCDVLEEYRQCVKDINSGDKTLAKSAAERLDDIKKNLRAGIDVADTNKRNALLDITKNLREKDWLSIEQVATDYVSRIGFLNVETNNARLAKQTTAAQEQEAASTARNNNLEHYNQLVQECIQLTGELSDAVAKHARVQREMANILQSGNIIPQELKDAREQIEEVISGYFKKDFFEPTLSTDGILMWLQSAEAAAISIDRLVDSVEFKYKQMLAAQSELDNTSKINSETTAIQTNTQAVEENIKAKKKQNKIKVRDLTREEYDAAQEKFQQENDGALESLEDTVEIIRQASEFGTSFSTQMETSCKRATTAVQRFFSAIDPNKYPAIASWKDSMLESVRSEMANILQYGYFSEKEMYNGMYTGQYSWGVEAIDEDRYYVFLNFLDVAKDKEKEYSAYLNEEFRKRDEGLEKQNELTRRLIQTYEKLNELHVNEPSWDENNEVESIKRRLEYYEQEKALLQDIQNLKEEFSTIPGRYVNTSYFNEVLRVHRDTLRFGDYGNGNLKDNARAIVFYQAELERAIKRLDKTTALNGQAQEQLKVEQQITAEKQKQIEQQAAANKEVTETKIPVTPVVELKAAQNAIEESTVGTPVEVPVTPVVGEISTTQVSNDIINQLTKGINIEQLLTKYGIPSNKFDIGIDLFKDLAGALYQEDGKAGGEKVNKAFAQLADFIEQNAERTVQVDKTLEEFYNYMSQVQIRIPENMEETFAAENPDNWKKIKKQFAIGGNYQNKKRLITTSKYASTPDVLLEELLANGFGYALGVDKDFNGSAQDSLRIILDAVQRAKDEAKLGKTQKIIGLDMGAQAAMYGDLSEAASVVEQNYLALNAAASAVNAGNDGVAVSAEKTGETLRNQARDAEDAAKAMESLQNQEQTDEKSVFPAEKVETEIDRIRKAIHSSEIGLDQIANTEGLQAAVATYVKSLDEIDDKKFKLISADINEMAEGVDRVTLKFQSLEDENVKLAQTWAMDDGNLTLGRLRTTKTFVDSESNFDIELERAVANSKVDVLQSQLIGIDHVSQKVTDSLTSLRTAAGNISSDSDIKTFAKNFQVAQNYVKEFKNEYKTLGSLANETQNAQAKMANAQETINAQISSSAKYIGVDGYDKVTQSIDNMTSALSKYNEAQKKIGDGGLDAETIGKYEKQMADAFTEYNKAEKQLGAAMKEVRANASFDTFSKSMKDAETVIDTAKLKLDKFGDLDGVDKASGYIENMTEAWKKFNDTDSTIEDKAKAVKDFTSANESFTKQIQYLNEVQKNAPKEESVSNVQTYYEQYVSAIKDLNNVNQQLFAYQGKNESGVYNGLIEQLQQQKIRILAQLQDINSSVEEEVLNIYNPISMDGDKYKFDLSRYLDVNTADTIKEFFNNASVEAELGAESIQKFIDVAMQSQKIDAAFGEGVAKQYKSINDLHESTKEFADTNAEQIFKSIQAGFAAKLTSGTDWTQEQENRLRSLIETYTEYATAIDKAVQKERKILSSVDGKNILQGDQLDPTKDMYDQMVDQAEKMRQATGATAVSIDGFDEATGRLTFTLDGADGKARTFTMSMTELGHVAVAQVKKIDKVKTGWDEFKGSLGGVGKQLLQYGLRMVEIYDIIRYLRQGFNEVLQIDTAMTELKKVTDETAVAYDNFAKSAYASSKKIGSTMKEFIQASADFARLGYSIDEASQLAEAANVYKNVGDGIDDVAQASESIISTMKAFNIEATDSMGIVDRFNEIGNNFAIDSVGIGEALKRSASALAEAGNSIDESIALVTGANSVVQNPEQVGEMLADYKVA